MSDRYTVTIREWGRDDVDEVEVQCEAPLPTAVKVGDRLEFTVTQVKRVQIERLSTRDRHEAYPDG